MLGRGPLTKTVLPAGRANDPWIPPNAYLSFDWNSNPRLTPLLPKGGGHVGFHGFGSFVPWHDRCIAGFIDRLADARAGRR